MSVFEFIFILLIALGIIPNSQIVSYFKKINTFRNSSPNNRRVIGDDSMKEEWLWLNDEHTYE